MSGSDYSSSPSYSDIEVDVTPDYFYNTKVLAIQDRPLVLRFLREHFYDQEPLNAYLHSVQTEKVRYFDRGLHAVSFISEGLSIAAYNRAGQIVAVMICGNTKSWGVQEANPIYFTMKKFMDKIQAETDAVAGVNVRRTKELGLKVICVHSKHRRKGLGLKILNRVLPMARLTGFSQIRSVCTNSFSAKLLANFGFQCVYALEYSEYEENGAVVFEPLEPHTHCRVMTLRI